LGVSFCLSKHNRAVRIAEGIHRIGTDSTVNSYLVEEGSEVTIIDAAMPGFWSDLPRELAAMGRTLDDVRALVLTHGHPDHIGFAERARRERGVPVSVHELDATLARGEIPNPGGAMGPLRPLPVLRFIVLAIRKAAMRTPHLGEVATFGDGATLDVPGAPRVILLPGHTPGSAALHLASGDALFVGDAMATFGFDGSTGPMIAAFTADRGQAVTSLDRLAGVVAKLVLPGHGEPWTGGVAAAVDGVRNSATAAGVGRRA
jgi:glyoxylase-like metal-dependent hydrolase (beta-lactamase superfamily II)